MRSELDQLFDRWIFEDWRIEVCDVGEAHRIQKLRHREELYAVHQYHDHGEYTMKGHWCLTRQSQMVTWSTVTCVLLRLEDAIAVASIIDAEWCRIARAADLRTEAMVKAEAIARRCTYGTGG